MRDYVTLPSWNGVAAGQTATISLPTSYVYDQIRIKYTESDVLVTEANMKAAITAVRVKINGKVQRRFTATELIALNAFYGQAYEPGYLPIFFAEPWRRTPQGEDSLAWGTADVSTFEIEADVAAGRIAPALSSRAEVERLNRPLGMIKKYRRHSIPVTATGVTNVTTLPKQDAYYAMHCFSGDIVDFEVKTDQLERLEAETADWTAFLKGKGLVPQSSVLHIAFDHTSRFTDPLPMRREGAQAVQDFRVDFNMGAANTFTLLAEVLGFAD